MKTKIKSFIETLQDIPYIIFDWYRDIKSWFKYNTNKATFKLVKEALTGKPYDYSYLLTIERLKLEEMLYYWENEDLKKVHSYNDTKIKTILKLLIYLNSVIDYNEKVQLEILTGTKYVNYRNLNRFYSQFTVDAIKDSVFDMSDDIYQMKAKHLYYSILKRYIWKIWD